MTRIGDGHTRSGLRLYLLGGFRIERNGSLVPDRSWQRRPARTVVKLLALAPSRSLHRDQLLEALWPEVDPETALDHLHKALSAARHALQPDLPPKGQSSYFRVRDETISLAVDGVWIDARHFERLARDALASDDPGIYEAAVAAYGGELLPEDRYEEWTLAPREALADLYRRVLFGLAGILERRGAYDRAGECLSRVLESDPTHEEAHRHLMHLHARRGSRHQALRQYQVCVQVLARELDVEPSPETRALYEEIASGRLGSVTAGTRPVPAVVRQGAVTAVIGRERALAALRADLQRVAGGTGGTTLISGEAGIGKSRLMIEIAREALDAGWTVLWGASREEQGILPYGAWIEAVEPFLLAQPESERNRLAAAYPELGRLLPSLPRGPARPTPRHPDLERTLLFAAIVRLMTELAASRPLLLVCDDLHAADPATIYLFHHLARAASARPWQMLGAYREEEVPRESELRRAAAALTRDGLCRHVELLRLSPPELNQLIRELLGSEKVEPRLVERLFALSLGNPLFTQELVREARDAGRLAPVGGTWQEVAVGEPPTPQGVRELVGARVGRMDAGVQETLALAATAGMTSSFELLATCAAEFRRPLSAPALLDALEAAMEARILDEREDGYAFRHPLLRAALYDRLSEGRRRWLHRIIAAAMERRDPTEVEMLAFHYDRAHMVDKAIVYFERAGDRAAAVYATESAAGHYREALSRLRLLAGNPRAVARVEEKLGVALFTAGWYDDALEVLERPVRAYREQRDLEAAGRVTAQMGLAHYFQGRADEGIALVLPMLELLAPRGPSPALAVLYVALATLHVATGRRREMREAAERAAEVARSLGDERLLAEAEARRALALLDLDQPAEALSIFQRAIPLIEQGGDLFVLFRALINAGVACRKLGRIEECQRYSEEALVVVERIGNPNYTAFVLANLGHALITLGDWERAREHLDRAQALLGDERTMGNLAPLVHMGRLAIYQGRWEAAAGLLGEALAVCQRTGDRQYLEDAAALQAELEVLADRPNEAIRRLEARAALEEADIRILPTLAWAYLEAGAVERAAEAAAGALQRARAGEQRFHLLEALRVEGMIRVRQDRFEEAERAFQEALELARALPHPYAQAHILSDLGLLAAARGEPEGARAYLEDALALFRRLGAQKDVAQAEKTLVGLAGA